MVSHLFSWWFCGLIIWVGLSWTVLRVSCKCLQSLQGSRWLCFWGLTWVMGGDWTMHLSSSFRLSWVCSYGSLAHFQERWQKHAMHLEVWAWNWPKVASTTLYYWSNCQNHQDSRSGETCSTFDGRSCKVALQRGMGTRKGRELWHSCSLPSAVKTSISSWS